MSKIQGSGYHPVHTETHGKQGPQGAENGSEGGGKTEKSNARPFSEDSYESMKGKGKKGHGAHGKHHDHDHDEVEEKVRESVGDNFEEVAEDKKAFHRAMKEAFGPGYDKKQAEILRKQILAGEAGDDWLPEVEFVDGSELDGEESRYDPKTNKILVDRELADDEERVEELVTGKVAKKHKVDDDEDDDGEGGKKLKDALEHTVTMLTTMATTLTQQSAARSLEIAQENRVIDEFQDEYEVIANAVTTQRLFDEGINMEDQLDFDTTPVAEIDESAGPVAETNLDGDSNLEPEPPGSRPLKSRGPALSSGVPGNGTTV